MLFWGGFGVFFFAGGGGGVVWFLGWLFVLFIVGGACLFTYMCVGRRGGGTKTKRTIERGVIGVDEEKVWEGDNAETEIDKQFAPPPPPITPNPLPVCTFYRSSSFSHFNYLRIAV